MLTRPAKKRKLIAKLKLKRKLPKKLQLKLRLLTRLKRELQARLKRKLVAKLKWKQHLRQLKKQRNYARVKTIRTSLRRWAKAYPKARLRRRGFWTGLSATARYSPSAKGDNLELRVIAATRTLLTRAQMGVQKSRLFTEVLSWAAKTGHALPLSTYADEFTAEHAVIFASRAEAKKKIFTFFPRARGYNAKQQGAVRARAKIIKTIPSIGAGITPPRQPPVNKVQRKYHSPLYQLSDYASARGAAEQRALLAQQENDIPLLADAESDSNVLYFAPVSRGTSAPVNNLTLTARTAGENTVSLLCAVRGAHRTGPNLSEVDRQAHKRLSARYLDVTLNPLTTGEKFAVLTGRPRVTPLTPTICSLTHRLDLQQITKLAGFAPRTPASARITRRQRRTAVRLARARRNISKRRLKRLRLGLIRRVVKKPARHLRLPNRDNTRKFPMKKLLSFGFRYLLRQKLNTLERLQPELHTLPFRQIRPRLSRLYRRAPTRDVRINRRAVHALFDAVKARRAVATSQGRDDTVEQTTSILKALRLARRRHLWDVRPGAIRTFVSDLARQAEVTAGGVRIRLISADILAPIFTAVSEPFRRSGGYRYSKGRKVLREASISEELPSIYTSWRARKSSFSERRKLMLTTGQIKPSLNVAPDSPGAILALVKEETPAQRVEAAGLQATVTMLTPQETRDVGFFGGGTLSGFVSNVTEFFAATTIAIRDKFTYHLPTAKNWAVTTKGFGAKARMEAYFPENSDEHKFVRPLAVATPSVPAPTPEYALDLHGKKPEVQQVPYELFFHRLHSKARICRLGKGRRQRFMRRWLRRKLKFTHRRELMKRLPRGKLRLLRRGAMSRSLYCKGKRAFIRRFIRIRGGRYLWVIRRVRRRFLQRRRYGRASARRLKRSLRSRSKLARKTRARLSTGLRRIRRRKGRVRLNWKAKQHRGKTRKARTARRRNRVTALRRYKFLTKQSTSRRPRTSIASSRVLTLLTSLPVKPAAITCPLPTTTLAATLLAPESNQSSLSTTTQRASILPDVAALLLANIYFAKHLATRHAYATRYFARAVKKLTRGQVKYRVRIKIKKPATMRRRKLRSAQYRTLFLPRKKVNYDFADDDKPEQPRNKLKRHRRKPKRSPAALKSYLAYLERSKKRRKTRRTASLKLARSTARSRRRLIWARGAIQLKCSRKRGKKLPLIAAIDQKLRRRVQGTPLGRLLKENTSSFESGAKLLYNTYQGPQQLFVKGGGTTPLTQYARPALTVIDPQEYLPANSVDTSLRLRARLWNSIKRYKNLRAAQKRKVRKSIAKKNKKKQSRILRKKGSPSPKPVTKKAAHPHQRKTVRKTRPKKNIRRWTGSRTHRKTKRMLFRRLRRTLTRGQRALAANRLKGLITLKTLLRTNQFSRLAQLGAIGGLAEFTLLGHLEGLSSLSLVTKDLKQQLLLQLLLAIKICARTCKDRTGRFLLRSYGVVTRQHQRALFARMEESRSGAVLPQSTPAPTVDSEELFAKKLALRLISPLASAPQTGRGDDLILTSAARTGLLLFAQRTLRRKGLTKSPDRLRDRAKSLERLNTEAPAAVYGPQHITSEISLFKHHAGILYHRACAWRGKKALRRWKRNHKTACTDLKRLGRAYIARTTLKRLTRKQNRRDLLAKTTLKRLTRKQSRTPAKTQIVRKHFIALDEVSSEYRSLPRTVTTHQFWVANPFGWRVNSARRKLPKSYSKFAPWGQKVVFEAANKDKQNSRALYFPPDSVAESFWSNNSTRYAQQLIDVSIAADETAQQRKAENLLYEAEGRHFKEREKRITLQTASTPTLLPLTKRQLFREGVVLAAASQIAARAAKDRASNFAKTPAGFALANAEKKRKVEAEQVRQDAEQKAKQKREEAKDVEEKAMKAAAPAGKYDTKSYYITKLNLSCFDSQVQKNLSRYSHLSKEAQQSEEGYNLLCFAYKSALSTHERLPGLEPLRFYGQIKITQGLLNKLLDTELVGSAPAPKWGSIKRNRDAAGKAPHAAKVAQAEQATKPTTAAKVTVVAQPVTPITTTIKTTVVAPLANGNTSLAAVLDAATKKKLTKFLLLSPAERGLELNANVLRAAIMHSWSHCTDTTPPEQSPYYPELQYAASLYTTTYKRPLTLASKAETLAELNLFTKTLPRK